MNSTARTSTTADARAALLAGAPQADATQAHDRDEADHADLLAGVYAYADHQVTDADIARFRARLAA